MLLRSDPHYMARITLIFETKSADWVNSLGSTELAFIYEIQQKQVEKIKKMSENK